MFKLRNSFLSIIVAVTAIGSYAQTAAQHQQHHPNTAAPASAAAASSRAAAAERMAAMDSKMKAMREMHEKMMNAKTPEERSALMAEHMKTMGEGMSMMGGMGSMGSTGSTGSTGGTSSMQNRMPADMTTRHQMMEKRMEMMEAMMQMMMDRLPAAPVK